MMASNRDGTTEAALFTASQVHPQLYYFVCDNIENTVSESDLVILAVPVGSMKKVANLIAPFLRKNTIVTDTGSTKRSVISDVNPYIPDNVYFIPSHPLAGTEYSGPKSGFSSLFENRYWLIVHDKQTNETKKLINLVERYNLTKKIKFILHTVADPKKPMRSIPKFSYSKEDIVNCESGSRYGPATSLDAFHKALDLNEPFAFVGKPCDIGAIRQLSKIDSRVNDLCKYLLTLVCGGIPVKHNK